MLQLEIVRGHVHVTGETEDYIRERAEHLNSHHPRILSCRVAIDAPTTHHMQGGPFKVAIDLSVPGRTIKVNHRQAEELHVAIRKAFDAADRQLESHAKTKRRHVRVAAPGNLPGKVARLFRDDGYGFIEADDGREIYFHQNAVLDGRFGKLEVGTDVHFAEEMGNHGPQASTVEMR